MKTTATLIATLMLGVASCAYAQGSPGKGAGGGGAGPAGVGIGSGGDGPGAGGPVGGGGEGPAGVRGLEGSGEGSGKGRGDGPAAEGRRSPSGAAAESPVRQGDDRKNSAGNASEKRGSKGDGDAKSSRADRKDDAASKPSDGVAEKAAEGVKSDAKPATKEAETNVRDKADDVSKSPQDTADKKDADPQRAERAERVKQVDLSGDKRERVQGAFRGKGDVKRRTDVDIDISIGRRLPRDWHFAPVPITVIEIVPEYRDYVFVYVEDEYVICDPHSYEVVAVVPAGGGRTYAGGGSSSGDRDCSTGIRLSEDQRELILKSVRLGREVDVADLAVGWSVPQDIELEKFPNAVLAEAGELAACRYFIADDQLAIVDPEDDKVVLLIDKS